MTNARYSKRQYVGDYIIAYDWDTNRFVVMDLDDRVVDIGYLTHAEAYQGAVDIADAAKAMVAL